MTSRATDRPPMNSPPLPPNRAWPPRPTSIVPAPSLRALSGRSGFRELLQLPAGPAPSTSPDLVAARSGPAASGLSPRAGLEAGTPGDPAPTPAPNSNPDPDPDPALAETRVAPGEVVHEHGWEPDLPPEGERDRAENGVSPLAPPSVPTAEAPPSPPSPRAPARAGSAAFDPRALQSLVEYAALTRVDSRATFLLGTKDEALGGLRVRVSTLGRRRLRLDVSAAEARRAPELASQLVRALREAGLNVAELHVGR